MANGGRESSFRRTEKRTGRYLLRVVEELADTLVGSLTVFSLIVADAWGLFFTGAVGRWPLHKKSWPPPRSKIVLPHQPPSPLPSAPSVGLVLVLFRNWFFANADWIAQNAQFFTDFVFNPLIDFANVAGTIVQLIIEVIKGIVSFFEGKPAFPPFHPKEIPFVTSTALQQACIELPRACSAIDTPEALFRLTATPILSNATCPLFRYLVPAPWLFNSIYPPARALSLTYAPFPPGISPEDVGAIGDSADVGNNCGCQASYGCGYLWQCIVLGSGYWVLEFVLPLILLGCCWQGWAEHLLKIATFLSLAAGTVAVRVVGVVTVRVLRLTDAIANAVEAVKSRAIKVQQEKTPDAPPALPLRASATPPPPAYDDGDNGEKTTETTGLLEGF